MYTKQEKTENPTSSVATPPKGLASGRWLGKLVKQHEKLKAKRHPMFERNRFTKFLMYFMVAYYAACMIMLGVSLPKPMGEVYHGVAGFHVLDGWFFVLLIADFWVRFIVQDTPANQIKPYSLLPISRNYLLQRYMRRAALTFGNVFWGFFLIPFGIMSVVPAMNVGALAGWLLGWWLLFICNSYFYLTIRSLCTRKMWWILLPIVLHAGLVCLALLPEKNVLDAPCTDFMYAFAQWKVWAFPIVLAVMGLLFWLNVKIQSSILYDEVGKKEDANIKNASQMKFFNRFGIVGEYLKLELKMKMRNRMMKVQFLTLIGLMLLLSCLLYFTQIYDGKFMTSFICLYDYLVPGMSTLVAIMCHEGNYMDLLMSRRESVMDLLHAKYYFNVGILLIPFVLLIPLTAIGKISIWMNAGYLLFVAGVLYPALFQMAYFNKETLPLNAKIGAKAGTGAQNIFTFVILFLPILIERVCVAFLGETWGYVVLMILGAVGVVTHRYWLRFTYKQFMKKRYQNMEGFRATRK